MNKKKLSFLVYINGWILSTFAALVIAGLVAAYPNQFSSETVKTWAQNISTKDFLIEILRTENHYFYQREEKINLFNISNTIFKLATNVQPTDTRTFLGSELPGFSIFDTDIVIAGEGTDFTTLPIESAPPIDVLLKEREMANEKLKNDDSDRDAPPIVSGSETVLIYHTHSWESFMPLLQGVTNGNDAVSSNESVNIVSVGRKLAEELNEKGIGTVHDTTDMTQVAYNDSYYKSREIVQEALAGNQNLHFLIDIHRDSLQKAKTTKTINNKSFARLFFIVGKEHKNYEQNLKIATELNEKLEAKYPGVSRGVLKKGKSEGNGIYNQDLSDRAILVEFGGVENDMTELSNTIEAFAEVFSDYYWQAEMVNG